MERITIELKSKSKRDMLVKILDAIGVPYDDGKNPSPSGDKWFLDSQNISLLKKGIADANAGEVIRVKDAGNIWESIL